MASKNITGLFVLMLVECVCVCALLRSFTSRELCNIVICGLVECLQHFSPSLIRSLREFSIMFDEYVCSPSARCTSNGKMQLSSSAYELGFREKEREQKRNTNSYLREYNDFEAAPKTI